MVNQNKLGKRIQRIRKKNNITQKDLAKLVGVTQGYVSKIENGTAMPNLLFVNKIRVKFNVNLDELLCRL